MESSVSAKAMCLSTRVHEPSILRPRPAAAQSTTAGFSNNFVPVVICCLSVAVLSAGRGRWLRPHMAADSYCGSRRSSLALCLAFLNCGGPAGGTPAGGGGGGGKISRSRSAFWRMRRLACFVFCRFLQPLDNHSGPARPNPSVHTARPAASSRSPRLVSSDQETDCPATLGVGACWLSWCMLVLLSHHLI